MVLGGAAVAVLPRMLAGCVMLHIGGELALDGLVLPWRRMDWGERMTTWGIAVAMAALGFEEGILVGIVLACFSFVAAAARQEVVRPLLPERVRLEPGTGAPGSSRTLASAGSGGEAAEGGRMPPRAAVDPRSVGAKSSSPREGRAGASLHPAMLSSAARERSAEAHAALEREEWRRHGLALQGTLFFGNAGRVAAEVERRCPPSSMARRYVLIDCGGVTAMDFSAAEVIADVIAEAASRRVTAALVSPPGVLLAQLEERGAEAADLRSVICKPRSWESELVSPAALSADGASAEPVPHPPVAVFADVDTALCFLEDVVIRSHA